MKIKKPKRCCHPDCQNCPYMDCEWDGYSREEDSMTSAIEKENIIQGLTFEKRKAKEIQDRYNRSEKGMRTRAAYRLTDGYKESQKRYRSSEKGMAAARERSKRYYCKTKLERECN